MVVAKRVLDPVDHFLLSDGCLKGRVEAIFADRTRFLYYKH